MGAEKVTDEELAQSKGKPHRNIQTHTRSTYTQDKMGRAAANSALPTGKGHRGKLKEERGRNVKRPFFPEVGFLPRGLNLSACAGLKPFDSNTVLSKRTSGLDSMV